MKDISEQPLDKIECHDLDMFAKQTPSMNVCYFSAKRYQGSVFPFGRLKLGNVIHGLCKTVIRSVYLFVDSDCTKLHRHSTF